jgi:hypothetical protein
MTHVKQFIVIEHFIGNGDEKEHYDGDDYYPIDTLEQIKVAQQALREEGIAEAFVWVGDPDCLDSYRTTNKLRV